MSRWKRGEVAVERLLASGDLDAITKSASQGSVVLDQARRRLKVAEAALAIDLDGAYTNTNPVASPSTGSTHAVSIVHFRLKLDKSTPQSCAPFLPPRMATSSIVSKNW